MLTVVLVPSIDHTNMLIGITLVIVIALSSLLAFIIPRNIRRQREKDKGQQADIITESFEMLGRELKSLKEQLIAKERLATLGEVSAGIAHEFRNPLAVILGNARILQKSMDEVNPQRDIVSSIINEVETMNAVMEELLKFSKSEPITTQDIGLARFLGDIVAEYQRPADISFEAVDDLLVRGDVTLLKQAVKNLVNNALEAGSHVWVSARRGQSGRNFGIFIEVRDNGAGLRPEDAEKVFTPFYTKKAGGLGIGLSLVQKIALAHGGLADVVCGEGKGCTFRLFIPFKSA